MSKSRVAITAGAAFLSAALAVVFLQGSTPEPTVEAEQAPIQTPVSIPAEVRSNPAEVANQPVQAWTYNCEFPEQRPKTILLTCADGGWLVTEIRWNSWTANSASGVGTYSENQCDPDCATGVRKESKVRVALSNPVVHKGRNILQTLDIEAENGSQLRGGRTSLSWNIAEFAIRMNWDN